MRKEIKEYARRIIISAKDFLDELTNLKGERFKHKRRLKSLLKNFGIQCEKLPLDLKKLYLTLLT